MYMFFMKYVNDEQNYFARFIDFVVFILIVCSIFEKRVPQNISFEAIKGTLPRTVAGERFAVLNSCESISADDRAFIGARYRSDFENALEFYCVGKSYMEEKIVKIVIYLIQMYSFLWNTENTTCSKPSSLIGSIQFMVHYCRYHREKIPSFDSRNVRGTQGYKYAKQRLEFYTKNQYTRPESDSNDLDWFVYRM